MDIKNPLRVVGVLDRGVGGGRGPRPDRHGRTRSYGSAVGFCSSYGNSQKTGYEE